MLSWLMNASGSILMAYYPLMRASALLVASVVSAGFHTGFPESDGLAKNASANAASGSTSVWVSVYVYDYSRAAETTWESSG